MRAQNNNRVVITYFSLSKTLASSCIKISRFSKFLHCMYDGGKGGVGAAHGTISTREFFLHSLQRFDINIEHAFHS